MRAQMRCLVKTVWVFYYPQTFFFSAVALSKNKWGRKKNLLHEFYLSASSLKPEHSGEHSEDKMPCQAVPPLLLPSTFTSLPFLLRLSLPFFIKKKKKQQLPFAYDALGLDGGARLGNSLTKKKAACLNSIFQRQTGEEKKTRQEFWFTWQLTIVISRELMKRQLFYLLLNTESLLSISGRTLSKWLMHTQIQWQKHSPVYLPQMNINLKLFNFDACAHKPIQTPYTDWLYAAGSPLAFIMRKHRR